MSANDQSYAAILDALGPIDLSTLGTRERLIWIAMGLFYTHGFHEVGLDRILAEVGVTKTTFYNHFKSKDELIVAVLQTRDANEVENWRQQIEERAEGCPRRALSKVFEALGDWLEDEQFLGCLFINAAHAFPNPSDPVHQAAAAAKQHMCRMIEDFARRAEATDPDTLAEQLLILVEGAITLRRVTGQLDAARIAQRTAEMVIDQSIPEAAQDAAAAQVNG